MLFYKEAKRKKFVKQKQFHGNETEVQDLVPLRSLEVENVCV